MEQEKTYRWIQDKLRELHTGQLSASDRMRLLKLAENDPFLKDALEGYHALPHFDHTVHLQKLTHRIRNKTQSRRLKLLPTRRNIIIQAVAASLVILFVTWAVIYYVGKKETSLLVSAPPPSAQIETADAIKQDGIADDAAKDLAKEGNSTTGLRADAELKAKEYLEAKDAGSSKNAIEEKTKIKSTPKADVKKGDKDVAINETAGAPVTASDIKAGTKTAPLDEPTPTGAAEMARTTGNVMDTSLEKMRVTGIIVDPYNQPLPGAFISVEQSNLAATSQHDGRFEIYIPDKTSNLEIASPGYKELIMPVKQGQEDVVIKLEPLRSIDVATLSTKDNATQHSAGEREDEKAFLEYIKAHSKFPVQDEYSNSCKLVTIRFTIDTKGRPSQIKSATFYADNKYVAEAMRLLEKGPDWSCEKGYPCEREYTFYFK